MSLRVAELRTALESVVDDPVHLLRKDGSNRLYVLAPPASDKTAWRRLLNVLRGADSWGSTDAHGAPEVWAEVGSEL
ncbi:hypothetical protein ACIO02_33845 [Streptomyces sp. NPDC087568]|uniref:hypothetical protein n=1 Tax=Streptomyces sp. NPDC087568 TaxID=3365799 RepID=UPI0037F489D9